MAGGVTKRTQGKKTQTQGKSAKGAQKKSAATQTRRVPSQAENVVFAMDIGTRSIIGMVGRVEEDRVKIIAIEREEHAERAMIDGQIENIDKVSALAEKVKKRLENKVRFKLNRVCVAAAGRALRTKRAEYEMELPGTQLIDDEIISRLEAGAIGRAEEAFDAEREAGKDGRRFYLVGYTVCQYFLDQYTISSLKDHRGHHIKADLIATFLPSEVVESLYTTMNKIGLEVASITLEPIAAINAAIPENLRLLNLALVDIGAGTSDIAACTGGSVTGYTMATVAGDEITETLMREYLVDFATAESIKARLGQEEEIIYTDILGFEQKLSIQQVSGCIQKTSDSLCGEIADKIVEINGGAPSALFLAGGGSKLAGLRDSLAAALQMDRSRVAIAGNYFQANAYSEEYDLNNPEYATPLGIAISSGLNLINDSFRVILNGRPAKLFRSGSFTALNLLMMNGYSFRDVLGRSGPNLTVTVNGARKVFYGTPAQPASLLINKQEGQLSMVIHAGDSIDFEPAVSGTPAKPCLQDVEGAAQSEDITLNGVHVPLSTPLKTGDAIWMKLPGGQGPAGETAQEKEGPKEEDETVHTQWREEENSALGKDETEEDSESAGRQEIPERDRLPQADAAEQTRVLLETGKTQQDREPDGILSKKDPDSAAGVGNGPAFTRTAPREMLFRLNGMPLSLPRKEDGSPYYLMDLIQYSGIDLDHPRGTVRLLVNGMPGMFQQALREGDRVDIEEESNT